MRISDWSSDVCSSDLLDANAFQHVPYLDNQIATRGYDIVPVGNTIVTPIGAYSNKVKSLDELATGARVGIPNDPTNGGRALLLFQAEGLIQIGRASCRERGCQYG